MSLEKLGACLYEIFLLLEDLKRMVARRDLIERSWTNVLTRLGYFTQFGLAQCVVPFVLEPAFCSCSVIDEWS